MSGPTWTCYGIGFPCGSTTLKTLGRFLIAHKNSLISYGAECGVASTQQYVEELLSFAAKVMNTEPGTEERERLLEEFRRITDYEVIPEPIALVMQIETGISFEPCPTDVEGVEAVILSPKYPWCQGAEKNMTYDEVVNVIKRYTAELELPDECIDELELTYPI